ncbi:hypothetical protein K438DRAFT_382598 [Mycena galopus ATCC 62051]|nr:hypothetical protein K438DRAFT_382598 [Mycena galopus ATCC 62051]
MRNIVLLGGEFHHISVMNALAFMETPKLNEIVLFRCWVWDPPSISGFLQRSGCSLETLVLQDVHVRPAPLLELFAATPTLGTLVLADNPANTVTNLVLDALTVSESARGITALPALHTLVLRGAYLFSINKLLTMLASRMRSEISLANIDIALPREISASDSETFAALPGVVSTYTSGILCIHAGRRWQYTDYRR